MNPIYDAVCRDLEYWPLITVNFIQNDSFESSSGVNVWNGRSAGTREFNKPTEEDESYRPGFSLWVMANNVKYWVPNVAIEWEESNEPLQDHIEDQYSEWANKNSPVV